MRELTITDSPNSHATLLQTHEWRKSEFILRQLLENHLDLLAGEQMSDGAPRRWLLVRHELPIATEQGCSHRYLDRLYLDQDANPTLVEVKCSTAPRIRREVIARVSVPQLKADFDETSDSARRMEDFLRATITPADAGAECC